MVYSNSDGANKIPSSSLISYISCLSDELLVEIFCRLGSSKYAVRCKCISKRWFSIIDTNSYFLQRWRKIHQKVDMEGEELPIVLLTQYRNSIMRTLRVVDYPSSFNKELPKFKFSFYKDFRASSVYVLATFKDLVLCSPTKIDHSVYYIFNPFTRQGVVLPPPPPQPPCSKVDSIRVCLLASDNDTYGYDLKFKVVRIVNRLDPIKVEIFSSDDSSGKWRGIEMSGPQYCISRALVSYDGMLFCLRGSSKAEQLIRFKIYPHTNVADVNCIHLPLPPGFKTDNLSSHLGVCRRCLRIAQLTWAFRIDGVRVQNQNAKNIILCLKLTIWELDINSHNQEWELLVDELNLSVALEDLCIYTTRICLVFHPHDRDILYFGFIDETTYNFMKSYICLCNLRNETVEVIRKISGLECKIFLLELPSWPTSLPRLDFELD